MSKLPSASQDLPIINCPSLHRLAELVAQEQQGRERDPDYRLEGANDCVEFSDPTTRLSDLLKVELDEHGKIRKLAWVRSFYWELWDARLDADDQAIARYDFDIELIGTQIGRFETNTYKPAGTEHTIIHFDGNFALHANRFLSDVDLRAARFSKIVQLGGNRFDGELDLSGAHFQAAVEFSGASFGGQVRLLKTEFEGPASFWGAGFHNRIDLSITKFQAKADFGYVDFLGSAVFQETHFGDEASFEESTFGGVANFTSARFDQQAVFNNGQFSGEAYFEHAAFGDGLSFNDVSFESSVFLDEIRLINSQDKYLIDLSGCTVSKKISFNLSESQEQDYGRIILALHNSNIAYFCCDDREFVATHLLWQRYPVGIENNEGEDEGSKVPPSRKTQLERYLHELRIKRRILQDMNWGDLADDCYAAIMDQQLELKQCVADALPANQRWRRRLTLALESLVFKDWFGWGIRLRRTILIAVVWVVLFWGYFFAAGYAQAASLGRDSWRWVWQSLAYSLESFLVINVPAGSGLPPGLEYAGILEAAVGYTLCTVFVVILARKFMRL